MNDSPQVATSLQALDNLAKLDKWTEEPVLACNAIPASPKIIQRFRKIAAEQGATTEEILSRALAALEAQSTI